MWVKKFIPIISASPIQRVIDLRRDIVIKAHTNVVGFLHELFRYPGIFGGSVIKVKILDCDE